MAPLLNLPAEHGEHDDLRLEHDLPRLAFFQANPLWTSVGQRGVAHAISFARRHAEQGDFEISGRALEAVILINASYVAAKGKTFFASNPFFDISQASDGFINETLEHLRRLARVSTVRGDEEAVRQILTAMAALVQTYIAIDYAARNSGTKEHALLAAGYLTGAVEGVLPRNLPDLAMEGIRLMGASARRFLAIGHPNDITALVDKIATFSIAGVVKPDYRAVTLTGMEQLAHVTFDLLRTQAHDIRFAARQLRDPVEFIVQMFLNVTDNPLANAHSNYLAPYYSLTKTQALGDRLTKLCNALIGAEMDDKIAKGILRNIQTPGQRNYIAPRRRFYYSPSKTNHTSLSIAFIGLHM